MSATRPDLSNPRARMIEGFRAEYEDDFLQGDYEALADAAFDALREPSPRTVALFLEELDEAYGQAPDPAGHDEDASSRRTHSRRLAITYAWRRAIDLMKRGHS